VIFFFFEQSDLFILEKYVWVNWTVSMLNFRNKIILGCKYFDFTI